MTPMMKQYYELKARTEGSVLFFRLGDFYEMFDDDARLVSKLLDIALTTRDRTAPPEEQTPMCGVPYHSSEAYIARLLAKGYSVAVCEQMGDPALAKGLVERKVVRYLTPGTVTETTCLEESRHNYLMAMAVSEQNAGLCFADVSTGQIVVTTLEISSGIAALQSEIARFSPREAIFPKSADLSTGIDELLTIPVSRTDDETWEINHAKALVEETFGSHPVIADEAIRAVGAALSYIRKTQQYTEGLLGELQVYEPEQYVLLDASTRRHLELTESMTGNAKKGSLLSVLDKSVTPMGKRLLRYWIERPLRNKPLIEERYDGIEAFVNEPYIHGELIEAMKPIGDLERLTARCAAGTATARDIVSLARSCEYADTLKSFRFKAAVLTKAVNQIGDLSDIAAMINAVLVENPPAKHNEGGIICPGASAEVDRLRGIVENTKVLVAATETAEGEKTGIKTLKIGYNRARLLYPQANAGELREVHNSAD
jgi:DNA mismatch repair protein MutS